MFSKLPFEDCTDPARRDLPVLPADHLRHHNTEAEEEDPDRDLRGPGDRPNQPGRHSDQQLLSLPGRRSERLQ